MKTEKKHLHHLIQFDAINVNAIDTNSRIFVGTNFQCCWNSHQKENTGFGQVSGSSNIVQQNMNILYDNDLIDTPIDDRDLFIHNQHSSPV